MSRMTVSINRINEMLDSISGLDGYAADLVEKGIEPMVKSIVDFLHKTSDDLGFEPLTLEQLQQLAQKDELAWIQPIEGEFNNKLGGYGIILKDEVFTPCINNLRWAFKDYKKTWIAYSKNPNDI